MAPDEPNEKRDEQAGSAKTEFHGGDDGRGPEGGEEDDLTRVVRGDDGARASRR